MPPPRLLPILPLALASLLGCSRSVLPLEPGADVTPADVGGSNRSECTGGRWSDVLAATIGPRTTGVAVDRDCNAFVVGGFNDTVDFGNGPLVSAGGVDAFVVKLSAGGEALWSQRFGDAEDQQVVRVTVDDDGNVILAGHCNGSIDLGGGPLPSWIDGAFLAKLDASGEHIYSRSFGGSLAPVRVTGLSAGPNGEAALKGYFEGSVDFGGGTVATSGHDDIYVAKFDHAGNHVFDRQFGDSEYQSDGGAVAVDAEGNVLITGGFQGVLDFGDGPVQSLGDHDIFLVKLDPSGDTRWSRTFGGPGFEQVGPIAVDSRGRVAIAGSFEGTVDFGGGPLTSTLGYHFNLFVAQLSPLGIHEWSKAFGDVDGEEATGLAFDQLDQLLLAGNFAGGLVLGDQALVTKGGWDIFTVRFSQDGNPSAARQYGDNQSQQCVDVAVDPLGHMLMTGTFYGSLDMGSGPMQSTPGDGDAFISRIPL